MKKIILLATITISTFVLNAQVKTPKKSPLAKITQTIGLTEASVTYFRPSVKGRTIFGGLQAYNEIWRTGANNNTIITFSDTVVIDGKKLEAGSYSLYTKPGKKKWEVYFYKTIDNWGNPKKWDSSKIVLKTTVSAITTPSFTETFTINFDNLTNNSAVLGLLWEKTYVGIKINVPTLSKAIKNIDIALAAASPSAVDYSSAAIYYLEEGKDLNKAKEWIDKSIALNGKAFWAIRQQALIYAELGDLKGAIAVAKKSSEVAIAAGNTHYVKLNNQSIKEWMSK